MVNLIEAQARERTDEVLEDTIWESARLGEEQWESLKVNESKVVEQELDDEDRQLSAVCGGADRTGSQSMKRSTSFMS
jgi:hypothetical protein